MYIYTEDFLRKIMGSDEQEHDNTITLTIELKPIVSHITLCLDLSPSNE